MTMSSRIRAIAGGVLLLSALSGWTTVARAAGSIFDDEAWEDPKIEETKKPKSPRPTKVETPPPPPVDPATPTPPPVEPSKPDPTPVQPAEPAKPTPPQPVDLTPRDLIKLVNERIKAAGAQPAKLSDDSMITLFHQKAVAHAQLGELPAARDAMLKVMNATKWNRGIILNAARIDIAGKTDAMRAAVNMEKYLKTIQETDEEALELWGMALATYARGRGKIPEAKEVAFVDAQTLLEKSRVGQKRWGNSWISDAEYRKFDQERNTVLRKMDFISRQMKIQQDNFDNADRNSRRNYRPGRANRPDPYYVRLMEEADAEMGRLKKEMAEERKKLPRPSWVIPLRMDEPDPVLIAK